MWKSPFLIVLGFAVGVIATLSLAPESPTPSGTASTQMDLAPVETSSADLPLQTDTAPVGRPTLAEINALKSDFEQTLGLYELMRDMGSKDLLDLLDEASVISGPDYVAATSIIFGRLGELDPEAALGRALRSTTLAQPAWIHAIFASWARLDADAARAALDDMPAGLSVIARSGINRSTGLQMPTANIGVSTTGVLSNLSIAGSPNLPVDLPADTDLPTAWEEAMNITNSQQRMRVLAQIAGYWALTDPRAALQVADGLAADGMRQAIQQLIIMRWVKSEPRAAFEWVKNAPNTQHSGSMIQAAIQMLAQSDFAGAQALVESLDEDRRDQATLGLLTQWAQQDVEGLKSWLASQTNQVLRHRAIQQVTTHLVTQDPQAAQSWLAELSDSEAASGTAIAVAMLANSDINGAAEFVDALEQSRTRDIAAQSLVQQWSRFSPEGAADWIVEQTRNSRPELYKALTQSWGSHAPNEAFEFAERLLDAGERDHALVGVLPYLSEQQQQGVMNLIQDDDLKKQATELMTLRASRR